MLLPDPRMYPSKDVKNSVIVQLNATLNASADQRDAQQASLEFLLSQFLERDDQEAIAVALSLAPNPKAYQHLWQTVKKLVCSSTSKAIIFAIPVVLVAGGGQEIPHQITQVDDLRVLVNQDAYLSRELYTTEALAELSLPQLFRWQSALQYASAGLPVTLPITPITYQRQGVILRFLVGISMQSLPDHPDFPVKAAKILQEDLQQEGVMLYAIPRPPQPLLEALDIGRHVFQDISLQVFLSDTLRQQREQRKTPVATIASYAPNEVRLKLSSEQNPEKWEAFVWPLQMHEHPAQIGQQMEALLHDCQVEQIHTLADIQTESRQ